MKKIVAAGHICIDITPVFSTERKYSHIEELLAPGKLVQVGAADVHTGGSVANTGLALKILGNEVRLVGKVGQDAFGGMVRAFLQRYGAADDLLVDSGSSTSYTIALSISGIDRVFLHNPGANDTFCNADIPESVLDGAAHFHFGYPPLMRRMYADSAKELTALFSRVKAKEIATSMDMAAVDPASPAGKQNWKEILAHVLPYVDFFVPSFEELCFMLEPAKYAGLLKKAGNRGIARILNLEADVKPLADTLMKMGCKVVLIKCGARGMYYRTADKATLEKVGARISLNSDDWANQEGFQRSFKAPCVLSATGAGDTSIAAYLTAMLRGKAPARCAALAAAEGTCALAAYDALGGLQPLDTLETRLDEGWEFEQEDAGCL